MRPSNARVCHFTIRAFGKVRRDMDSHLSHGGKDFFGATRTAARAKSARRVEVFARRAGFSAAALFMLSSIPMKIPAVLLTLAALSCSPLALHAQAPAAATPAKKAVLSSADKLLVKNAA